MPYFANADEVYKYIGGAFRLAEEHPVAGPKLRGANVIMRVDYTDPKSSLTVRLVESGIEVIEGESDVTPDVQLTMSADNANKFWRGQYNAAMGLAKGEAKAKGPISKILKLLPAAKPVFPLYTLLVEEKDRA
jgi:putative sterol carrier protein